MFLFNRLWASVSAEGFKSGRGGQVTHRPAEGFMNSIAMHHGRSIELPRHVLIKVQEAGSLAIVDSSGLKVYGKDEWH